MKIQLLNYLGCIIFSTFLATTTHLFAQYEVELAAVESLGDLVNPPAMRTVTGNITTLSSGEVKEIMYDGVDYQGGSTRVYAYIGLPEGASASNPVPAVVLVHGGGGTAFEAWVDLWNDRGYAAISMDTEGRMNGAVHQWGGPQRTGIYNDMSNPIGDHFMYHAVSDAILANSLLRSLPEVNEDQVGIVGISWGGVITSTTIGIDDRFAFAIPVYGCGDMDSADNWWGNTLSNNNFYMNVWDPTIRLHNAKMPTAWTSWPEDLNFPIDRQAVSYRAMPGVTQVSLIPGMGHGHGVFWLRPESYDFADSIITTGRPWCEQIQLVDSETSPSVKFRSDVTLTAATLIYTTDTGVEGERTWNEVNAGLQDLGGDIWRVTTNLPTGSTGWFFNVTDGVKFASSGYQASDAGSDITPYAYVNGVLFNARTLSLTVGDTVNFAPHPASGGAWSWSGPNGYTSSSRFATISNFQSINKGDYIVTYTNDEGDVSRMTFILETPGETNNITPVAYWALDDGSGLIAVDSSGNGFDATVQGAAWRDGNTGGALEFNGSSSFVTLPSNAFAAIDDQITISMWVYGDTTQPRADTCFYAINGAGQRLLNIHLPWSNSTVFWDAGFNGSYDRTQVAIDDSLFKGDWNHWVFTKNTSTGEMKIYVNGGLVQSATGKVRSMAGITSASFGGSLSTFSYDGLIDEVALYDVAMSDEEVELLYKSYSLNADWSMDEGSGSIIGDLSGNFNNATLLSGAWTNGYTNGGISFNGTSDTATLPESAFEGIESEVTISVWTYGGATLPDRSTLLYATNESRDRIMNIHLPWINSTVFWDAGYDGEYDRINKVANASDFKDGWNHWAFTKNATVGEMKIFLNGQLWHQGTGKMKAITGITKAYLGYNGVNLHYDGVIDNLKIFKVALSESEVLDLYNAN